MGLEALPVINSAGVLEASFKTLKRAPVHPLRITTKENTIT
jgi:hypothetical protein